MPANNSCTSDNNPSQSNSQENNSKKCQKCQRQKTSCKMEKEHSWKRISDPVFHKQEICQRKQNKDNQQEQNDKLHN